MAIEFYNRNWRVPSSWNGTEDNNNKVSNYSMSFDGSSESIQTSNIASLNNVSKFSISYWFNVDSLSNFKRFLGSYIDTSNWLSFNFKNSTGELQFVIRNGDSTKATFEVVSSGKVQINNWYNINVVFDGVSPKVPL